MILVDRRCLWLLLLLLASCDNSSSRLPEYELGGSTMGTTFSVKLLAPASDIDQKKLQMNIEDLLFNIENRMSTYRADSELARFNAANTTEWLSVSTELCEAIENAGSISRMTGGAFDVTVGPLVNLWGFGPGDPIAEPPDDQKVAEALLRVGYGHLHTKCSIPSLRKDLPNVYVDLSAYAKGLAVDRIVELLEDRKVGNYLVEIGGEVRARGQNSRNKPWALAIEKPLRFDRAVHTIVPLTDAAMATSGDYRNYFEHGGNFYSHTIDPRTGYPVSHNAASVTVIGDSAAFADGMATALLVLGPDEGFEFAEREHIAAYFQLRVGNEIEERVTAPFAEELTQ